MNQRISYSTTDRTWWYYPLAVPSGTNYKANSLNQYSAIGLVVPTYDANGNLTNDGVLSYAYDAENRLRSVTGPNLNIGYEYDANGHRKSKTVNGATTVYVRDAFDREILEYNSADGKVIHWNTYGLGPNDVLGQMNIADGTRATPIPDIQGSIIAMLDSSGRGISKFGYFFFGMSTLNSDSFGYTGQRFDSDTRIYYYRARMYSPALGRFLQTDGIGYPDIGNLYVYVGDDPLNNMDPQGHFCIPCGFAAGGAIVGIGVLGLHDYLAGSPSSWGTYLGAAASGAAGGLSLMTPAGWGGAVVMGGAGASIGNSVQQITDMLSGAQRSSYDISGGVIAIFSGSASAGMTKPFSGWLEVDYGPTSQGLLTKYWNDTIAQAQPETVMKMVGTEIWEQTSVPTAMLGQVITTQASSAIGHGK
jgi:RHS repeat-associated protein